MTGQVEQRPAGVGAAMESTSRNAQVSAEVLGSLKDSMKQMLGAVLTK